jgi:hypothetical protein
VPHRDGTNDDNRAALPVRGAEVYHGPWPPLMTVERDIRRSVADPASPDRAVKSSQIGLFCKLLAGVFLHRRRGHELLEGGQP